MAGGTTARGVPRQRMQTWCSGGCHTSPAKVGARLSEVGPPNGRVNGLVAAEAKPITKIFLCRRPGAQMESDRRLSRRRTPLSGAVVRSRPMLTLLPETVAAYVQDHAMVEPELLTELRAETVATLVDPQMQVGRVEGALLKLLVGLSRARRVLEIGTYSGYSALSMASGLPDGGTLTTCDLDPVPAAVAQRFFDRSPHGDKITLRLGPALETIAALAAEGASFDLAFLDADKENYSNYYEQILPLLPSGGLIVADNTLWSGRVLAPQSTSDHAIVAFNRLVAADERVESVLLPVRDGVTLARKR